MTKEPGYLLQGDPDAVDAVRFRILVAEAGGRSGAQDVDRLRTALDLWRGPALADLDGRGLCAGEVAGLEDGRRDAVVRLAGLCLELGRGGRSAVDLGGFGRRVDRRAGAARTIEYG